MINANLETNAIISRIVASSMTPIPPILHHHLWVRNLLINLLEKLTVDLEMIARKKLWENVLLNTLAIPRMLIDQIIHQINLLQELLALFNNHQSHISLKCPNTNHSQFLFNLNHSNQDLLRGNLLYLLNFVKIFSSQVLVKATVGGNMLTLQLNQSLKSSPLKKDLIMLLR